MAAEKETLVRRIRELKRIKEQESKALLKLIRAIENDKGQMTKDK